MQNFRTTRNIAAIALVAILAACSDKVTAPVASIIVLTPSASGALASIGDTRTLSAAVKSSSQVEIPNAIVTFASSNASVATVTSSGSTATITAVGNGTATVTATSGAASASLEITVAQGLATIALTAATPSLTIGSTSTLTAAARDAKGTVITGVTGYSFTTAKAGTAVVNSAGVVTAIAPGIVAITGSLTRDGVTTTASTNVTVTAPTTGFVAYLNGVNERPNATPVSSTGAAVFTLSGTTLNYVVTFQGLASGPVGLHIHSPAGANVNAGVSVDLLGTQQLPSTGVLTGSFTAASIRTPGVSLDSMLVLIRTGSAYVNVHSMTYPGGEVRGQLGTP